MKKIEDIRCFALDMDGTFYLGDRLLPGSREFLEKVRQTGRKFVFLTNNSSKSAEAYLQKLHAMGVAVTPEHIITSGQATIDVLQREFSGRRVFLLGNPVLAREFEQAGLVLDHTDPEVVVTAFDTTLDYAKMCKVCDFVRRGLPYLATHPDFNCPTEAGFIPDIGAIAAFIEASTGRTPDRVAGKPNRDIVDYTLRRTGSLPADTAMVGDRLYTDIATGIRHGLTSILVLTGETRSEDVKKSDLRPDFTFNSLADITARL